MKHCPLCGSVDITYPYTFKPPRKHPHNRIECDPECTKTGVFCRRCRVVTVPRETLKETQQ